MPSSGAGGGNAGGWTGTNCPEGGGGGAGLTSRLAASRAGLLRLARPPIPPPTAAPAANELRNRFIASSLVRSCPDSPIVMASWDTSVRPSIGAPTAAPIAPRRNISPPRRRTPAPSGIARGFPPNPSKRRANTNSDIDSAAAYGNPPSMAVSRAPVSSAVAPWSRISP